MTFLLIALGVVVYLLIGGIVAAILDEHPDLDVLIVSFWPLALIMFGFLRIISVSESLGHRIVKFFKHLIYKGERR